jgi:hypothetical protein
LRTLITGGKSAQALKLLKAFSGDQVILGDYGDMPAIVSAQYQLVDLGPRNDDTIAHNLLNACLDQEADRLLPIYDFELEAVIKSAVLFEEFNIHVLLPDSAGFPVYFEAARGDRKNWAVFDRGHLVYSTLLDSDLLKGGEKLNLNGAFYITEDENGINPALFMIS